MPAQLRGLEDRGDTALARVTGPLPQRLRDAVGQRVTAGGERLGRLAEEHRRRRGPHHAGAVRLVERLQQRTASPRRPPSRRCRSRRCRPPGCRLAQRVVTGAGVLVLLDDHRDVARLHPLAVEGGAAGQQVADVGGEVGGYVRAQIVDQQRPGPAAAQRLPAHHAQPERVDRWGAAQPGTGVVAPRRRGR